MLQVEGLQLHGLESLSNVGDILIQQQMNSLVYTPKEGIAGGGGGGLLLKSREQKSQEAANKHALAERNRRKRINSHLNTLRKLFPHLPKRDKPRVLTETVKYLKELRKKVADHHALIENGEDGCCINGDNNGNSSLFLPGEKDEVNVSCCTEGYYDHGEGEGKLLMVKALICCEDRPRLNRELTEAVKSVKGRVVKAEMATIGGRTKAVLFVQWCKDDSDGDGGGAVEIGSLRRALKAVVEYRALGCSALLGSKLLSSTSTTNLGFDLSRACTSTRGRPLSDGLFPGSV